MDGWVDGRLYVWWRSESTTNRAGRKTDRPKTHTQPGRQTDRQTEAITQPPALTIQPRLLDHSLSTPRHPPSEPEGEPVSCRPINNAINSIIKYLTRVEGGDRTQNGKRRKTKKKKE